MAEYFTSDLEHPVSGDALRAADRETQLEVMETWFRQHFEDSAERTPYESAEGGYIWIWGGLGADIIAFNRGDGQDIVNASTGADNTLSLGGGIRYTDLSFSKSANDLMLSLGNAEQITLKDWYATSANNKSVLNLQMIAEAMADFDSTSSDPLRNNKVETFNFGGLADRFDQARAADASLTSWSLTNGLLDFHLGGSDTEALGGDLAYQYGKTGTLAGLGVTPVQSVLSHAQFGTTPQALQPLATLQEGLVKLG